MEFIKHSNIDSVLIVGKRLKCDKRKNKGNLKKCDVKRKRKCYKNGKSTLRRQRMPWYSAKCLQRSQEGKAREYALINTLVTVVVLEEMKVGTKLPGRRNGKGKQVVNVRKERARVKEGARKKRRVEKVVR